MNSAEENSFSFGVSQTLYEVRDLINRELKRKIYSQTQKDALKNIRNKLSILCRSVGQGYYQIQNWEDLAKLVINWKQDKNYPETEHPYF